MSFRRIILILLLVLNYGCNDIPNDPLPNLFPGSVNAILMTGKQSQQVFFDRVLPLGDSVYTRYPNGFPDSCTVFIQGADVSINGNKLIEVNGKDCSEQYYEVKKASFVLSNEHYTLNIKKDDYVITGSTVVPDSFSIINHPKLQIVEKFTGNKEINLVWNKSKNAKGYIYQIGYNPLIFVNGKDSIFVDRYSSPGFINDTSLNLKLYRYETVHDSYDSFTIRVGAYDDNFEKYYIQKQQSVGITGAYGVFCSMAVDSIVMKVKEN